MFMPNRREFLRSIAVAGGGAFLGQRTAGVLAGEERDVDGVRLCWCPPGQFIMGSPAGEKDHRPDEAQVARDAHARLLDGEVRGHAGSMEADRRGVPREETDR